MTSRNRYLRLDRSGKPLPPADRAAAAFEAMFDDLRQRHDQRPRNAPVVTYKRRKAILPPGGV